MNQADISVAEESTDRYLVTVQTGGTSTTHRVTVTPDVAARLAPGVTPERLVEESFRFLLEREPKESILSSFEIQVIGRYFPDYPSVIADRLS